MEKAHLDRIYKKLRPFLTDPEELFLVQSIETQTLSVCNRRGIIEQYDASTSRFGSGNRENSYKTPLGLHRISDRIGSGAPCGRIFRERRDTGVDWDRRSTEDNLILTRILQLEGWEEGINRGTGVDSHSRFIYIHGTNREDLVGTPLSHGCIALRNCDVMRVFEMVKQGTLVYIDPPPIIVSGTPCRKIHLVGIFGTGMSSLAQYLRFQGIAVSGSDRLLGSDDTVAMQRALEELGCAVFSQDGSGVSRDIDAVCISTAIEESNPDIAAARSLGLPIVHRSDLLAAVISGKRTIAVAGTSGKSTVTAMIFEFLTACGKSPSLISGAPLRRLEKEGSIGNAWEGGSDLLVVEADESDGTLVKYSPEAAVVLNISKDHKTVDEITMLFKTLVSRSSWAALNCDDPALSSINAAATFGRKASATWRSDNEQLLPSSVRLFRGDTEYHLPLPGGHNLENLRAALCVCEHFGCDGLMLAKAVRDFEGVARRFSITNTTLNVRVVDDYAHNPAKIAAAVSAARGLSERIVAVYQPHGFGPTRFLKDEYIKSFRAIFRPGDCLYLLPIYYAGGTAQKDICSEDIICGLGPVLFSAKAAAGREALLASLKAGVRQGDCVLLMGARDPSLPALAKKIVELFGGQKE